jgi:hypothetical protein
MLRKHQAGPMTWNREVIFILRAMIIAQFAIIEGRFGRFDIHEIIW